MKNAIVTGANGFVGKAVVNELLKHNVKVFAIVRNTSNLSEELSNDEVEVIQCDMDRYDNINELIYEPVDCAFHFAWNGTSGPLRSDETVQISNVVNTCKLINSLSKLGCKKFVFASSIMEYEIDAVMKSGMMPPPSSHYSVAKITANYMSKTIAANNDIEYLCCLISNIFGPGENSPRLINLTIRKLISGEKTSFSSGEQLYDFIYITDAAKMFYEIGNHGISNKTYYIGNPYPRKLKDFLTDLRDVVSPGTELGLGKLEFNGISLKYTEFDTKSVYSDFGFVTNVSFKDGIQKTLNDIKRRM